MKVLFVCSGNSLLGISPIIKSQGESLKNSGIDIEYFTICGKGILGYLRNVPQLKNFINGKTYNLIHAHYGLCGIVAQLARRKEKLVVSFMGDDLIGAVGSNGNYSLFGNVLVMLNKIFLMHYDFVIVKSKELAEKVNRKDKEVIPNGVDLSMFFEVKKNEARARLKIEPDKRVIIFVSNPARKEKNFKLAEEAVKFLDNNKIQLLPVFNVNQEELKYYYSAADLLLLTSIHEGSPNVIKEAMTCNCPVVSTDVGDVRWIIGETEGCFLVSEKSPKGMASQNEKRETTSAELIKETSDKLREALEFAEKFGRTKGRERIIYLGLDSETVAKKIIKVYENVLNS